MNQSKAKRMRDVIRETVAGTTRTAIKALDYSLLSGLSKNCPGLENFDWMNYLYCSEWRVRKVLHYLYEMDDRYRGIQLPGSGYTSVRMAPILDLGSWLGNFSLALSCLAFNVTSSEMWSRYSPALDAQKKLLANYDVDTIDSSMIYGRPQGPRYGAVLFMSVIEHIPDSPRRALKIIWDMLLPGGYLILDTPNLAYIYNRRRLSRGDSIFPPIEEQWKTESPFEGHVREYTADELAWMLIETGFRVIKTSFYNYSMFGVKHPYLMNLRSLVPMALNPAQRELIFMVGQKPDA